EEGLAIDAACARELNQVLRMPRAAQLLLPHIFKQIVARLALRAAGVDSRHVLRKLPDKVPLLDRPLRELLAIQLTAYPFFGERVRPAMTVLHGLLKIGSKVRHCSRPRPFAV